MTKEFEQYIHDTRNEFVTAVNELQWNTGFRTKCENLLIAYDQMKQALRQTPVSGSLPPDEKFFELTEKICYQQFAADPMGDIVAKMSLIKQFINEQCLCGTDR